MVQPAQKATSTSSTASLVIKGPAARQQSGSSSSLELIKRTESGFEVYDAVCASVYCPTHKRFGFCKINSWKGLFLPVAVVTPRDGFEHGLVSRMKYLLQHPESSTGFIGHRIDHRCIEYTRIQVPVVDKFVTRATFRVTITGSNNNELCCKDVFSMDWMSVEDVLEQKGMFWGPEVATIVSGGHLPVFQEITCKNDLTLSDPVKHIVKQAGYNDADVGRIYHDFFQHVFPTTVMSRSSLIRYLRSTGVVNSDDHKQVDQIVDTIIKDKDHFLTFQEFLSGIATVDSESPIGQVKGLRCFKQVAANKDSMENVDIDETFKDVTRLSKGSGPQKDLCFKCLEQKLTYASYAATLTPDSIMVDPMAIMFTEEDQKIVAARVISREQVDHTSIGNTVIRWIHDHAEVNAPIRPFPKHTGTQDVKPLSLWSRDPKLLADYVIRMCNYIRKVMHDEPRLVEKMSPCYVIGSIFGSIADVLTLERLFFKRGIQFEGEEYIFLGNYHEIGDNSLEVLFYLIAIKSLAPHKVTLLRGQTEQRIRLRRVKDELKVRFGDNDMMRKLRDAICSVFDVMPLAALVNGHEFLTSSMLPLTIKNLHDINHIPCPLKDPEKDKIAKSILDACQDFGKIESSVEQQMTRLGISTLIRSFHWSTNAIQQQAKGRIISIWSNSNTKKSKNPCSLLLIDKGKIRSILIQDPRFPIIRTKSTLSLSIPISSTDSTGSLTDATTAAKTSSSLIGTMSGFFRKSKSRDSTSSSGSSSSGSSGSSGSPPPPPSQSRRTSPPQRRTSPPQRRTTPPQRRNTPPTAGSEKDANQQQ